ncbi:hypothetical protein Cgig2_025039 [Carnegiea gigantea]|uniref:DUF8040 domain-containing protein n=1 Tax=Carnegiea gigantea TaxID=171969 RepID=A0A9Q1K1A7_9CARY|nr:hypothetical protein Cgig2_025039 [Carnegiea gigantea]
MSSMAFFRLCEALEGKAFLASTVNMSVKGQVLIFLHLLGHNLSLYSMEKRKMKEVNEEEKTQFWWSKPMSKELLTFLANEVSKENRPNNSFKSSSYVAVANAISKKDKEFDFGWDDNLKMITRSPTVYNTYADVCTQFTIYDFFVFYGLFGFVF